MSNDTRRDPTIHAFIEQKIVFGEPTRGTPALRNADMFAALDAFCVARDVNTPSHRRLTRTLYQRGARQHPDKNDGRKWLGLRLA